jgi:hypothetical protein
MAPRWILHPERYARIMSSQALPRPKKSATRSRKKKKAAPAGRLAWWPLLAGVAITLAAVKTAEILPLMGADGLFRLRLLYPYALLLKLPQLGLSEQASDFCSQIMLYAQWTFYGLYVTLMMRWKTLRHALVQITAIHLFGFGLLWLLEWK